MRTSAAGWRSSSTCCAWIRPPLAASRKLSSRGSRPTRRVEALARGALVVDAQVEAQALHPVIPLLGTRGVPEALQLPDDVDGALRRRLEGEVAAVPLPA